MNKLICLILAVFTLAAAPAYAQKRGVKSKTAQKAPEPTPEELAAQALAAEREKRIEEMLPRTRLVTFIDSMVVGKDDFLSHLKITPDAGRFTDPQKLFANHDEQYVTGQAAFVNSLSSAVYFSAADSVGRVCLHASFRNGAEWSVPQKLQGLDALHYHDYPFLLSDGVTLYFAAAGDESIGGLDLFATRYSNSAHQFVRPENLGFPFNSTANDYLLAIDEATGIGALVSDRRQPDDKVCIYWFIAQDAYSLFDYNAEDEASIAEARGIAEISSIRCTQKDKRLVDDALQRWKKAINEGTRNDAQGESHRFVVNDDLILTDLAQFKNDVARRTAQQWAAMSAQLSALNSQLQNLRDDYALTRSQKAAQQIVNLEVQVQQLRAEVSRLAKAYRRQEIEALRAH